MYRWIFFSKNNTYKSIMSFKYCVYYIYHVTCVDTNVSTPPASRGLSQRIAWRMSWAHCLPGAPNRSGGWNCQPPKMEVWKRDLSEWPCSIGWYYSVPRECNWNGQMTCSHVKKNWVNWGIEYCIFYLKSKTFLRDFVRKHRCLAGKNPVTFLNFFVQHAA